LNNSQEIVIFKATKLTNKNKSHKIHKHKVTEIFFLADDFCTEFSILSISYTSGKKPKKKLLMATIEVITIMILFQLDQFKNIKHFYTGYIQKHMSNEFPKTPANSAFYLRKIELYH